MNWLQIDIDLYQKILFDNCKKLIYFLFQDNETSSLFLATTLAYKYSIDKELIFILKDLGIIHLLVLSGSQVGFINKYYEYIYYFLKMIWPQNTWKILWLIKKLVVIATLSLVCKIANFDPPIVRASIFIFIYYLNHRIHLILKILLCLILQLLIFPESSKSLSMLLSWISFLILILIDQIKIKEIFKIILLSILCQIVVILTLKKGNPGIFLWNKLIIANVIGCYFFNKTVFPLTAIITISGFTMCFISIDLAYLNWLKPMLSSINFLIIHFIEIIRKFSYS